MDVVGSEIGQKMRSAIKAKLTELGCYVDDELPDYVMVMVANKRTRAQMEDDLQLFLGDNTELFVNWLHQVLKKLQEVTIAAPLKGDTDKSKDSSKERKSKDKKSKEKLKKSELKKSKKKKEKHLRKKEEKKINKEKKKSKHDMIRPNIPPLLMNMEKDSEPSITDVFAGQILKNHGITLNAPKDDEKPEIKLVVPELKRPILPIIDPATISTQAATESIETKEISIISSDPVVTTSNDPQEEQIKEMTEIEAKIQGLKQKLAEQLDSMSDDEDFLNIRTEAEELMNDFAEDVFQEISQQTPSVATPPILTPIPPSPPIIPNPTEYPKEKPQEPMELPQIELNLPKRPIRERLGAREEPKIVHEVKEKEVRIESPERFTPEREPDFWPRSKSAKSRLGDLKETSKKSSSSDDKSTDSVPATKKMTSKVSVLENRPSRSTCASVVRVRPRPRVSTPANSLLLRAVADAHKSLLNTPQIVDKEPQQVKRGIVLPMRRCVDAQKIVIQVAADAQETGDSISLGVSDDDMSSKMASDLDRDEYVPAPLTKMITNTDYTPSRRTETRTSSRKDDSLIIETINIHNPSVGKDKSTQFIVTMDGYHPNAFLAKKLQTEGLLNDEEEIKDKTKETPQTTELNEPPTKDIVAEKNENVTEKVVEPQKKRLSSASEENETNVVIKKEKDDNDTARKETKDKRKLEEIVEPPVKKRKASPIVFDVLKRDKDVERVRERTESVSSDSHVVVNTVASTHKYDTVPPLSAAERKLVWCRSFPLCRYGSACAFAHPKCKFAASCTRRNCVYSHAANALTPPVPASPSVASHVVPVANYKSISAVVPNICKFYPNCVNPGCHFYHPKPCRYGKSCTNKLECNFYHADAPHKWQYPV